MKLTLFSELCTVPSPNSQALYIPLYNCIHFSIDGLSHLLIMRELSFTDGDEEDKKDC